MGCVSSLSLEKARETGRKQNGKKSGSEQQINSGKGETDYKSVENRDKTILKFEEGNWEHVNSEKHIGQPAQNQQIHQGSEQQINSGEGVTDYKSVENLDQTILKFEEGNLEHVNSEKHIGQPAQNQQIHQGRKGVTDYKSDENRDKTILEFEEGNWEHVNSEKHICQPAQNQQINQGSEQQINSGKGVTDYKSVENLDQTILKFEEGNWEHVNSEKHIGQPAQNQQIHQNSEQQISSGKGETDYKSVENRDKTILEFEEGNWEHVNSEKHICQPAQNQQIHQGSEQQINSGKGVTDYKSVENLDKTILKFEEGNREHVNSEKHIGQPAQNQQIHQGSEQQINSGKGVTDYKSVENLDKTILKFEEGNWEHVNSEKHIGQPAQNQQIHQGSEQQINSGKDVTDSKSVEHLDKTILQFEEGNWEHDNGEKCIGQPAQNQQIHQGSEQQINSGKDVTDYKSVENLDKTILKFEEGNWEYENGEKYIGQPAQNQQIHQGSEQQLNSGKGVTDSKSVANLDQTIIKFEERNWEHVNSEKHIGQPAQNQQIHQGSEQQINSGKGVTDYKSVEHLDKTILKFEEGNREHVNSEKNIGQPAQNQQIHQGSEQQINSGKDVTDYKSVENLDKTILKFEEGNWEHENGEKHIGQSAQNQQIHQVSDQRKHSGKVSTVDESVTKFDNTNLKVEQGSLEHAHSENNIGPAAKNQQRHQNKTPDPSTQAYQLTNGLDPRSQVLAKMDLVQDLGLFTNIDLHARKGSEQRKHSGKVSTVDESSTKFDNTNLKVEQGSQEHAHSKNNIGPAAKNQQRHQNKTLDPSTQAYQQTNTLDPRPPVLAKKDLVQDIGLFTNIDLHARKAPNELRKSLPDLVKYLCKNTTDPLLKVRAFFVWIANNIRYDTEGYFGKKEKSPCDFPTVMETGLSVCEGYANVMQAMCREADIDVKKISGFAKGVSHSAKRSMTTRDRTNHAWNAVLIKGNWFLLDGTWGAGNLHEKEYKAKFKEFYFLVDPCQLIYSHFPYMNNDMQESMKWQLLDNPVSLEQFNSSLRIRHNAFTIDVLPESHKHGVILFDDELKLSFQQNHENTNVFSISLYKEEGQRLKEEQFCMYMYINYGKLNINVKPPTSGDYRLKIYGRRASENVTDSMPELFEYILHCTVPTDKLSMRKFPYPKICTQAFVDKCEVLEPFGVQILPQTEVRMRFRSPYLKRMMINKKMLTKNGDLFEGTITSPDKNYLIEVYGSQAENGTLSGQYKFCVG